MDDTSCSGGSCERTINERRIIVDAEYTETSLRLTPSDSFAFFSDGVVEAQSPTGELFGFERTALISRKPAQEIADAAQAFGQEDDITVLTLQFAPAPPFDALAYPSPAAVRVES
jgi:hypothetical protein